MRGDGKVEDCEMELVMITRGEEALTRTGSSSLISRWWESTLTANVVSKPSVEKYWKRIMKISKTEKL